MINWNNQIIQLEEVKNCIKFALNSDKIVCIGVDGPTASGKTVFAKLLQKEISNISKKRVQIIPLDSLLIERKIREKSLKNIKKVGIPFEFEAEVHMRFSKLRYLVDLINLKKKDLSRDQNIILKDLYSRSDKGQCTGNLEINLTNETVLIFEGHYTVRPEFDEILDNNFILLANRDNLIKRKINRVADYRDKKEVEEYFDQIDEPSYLSNYYRFASNKSLIIDNTDFSNPFLVDYEHIEFLLNSRKFLDNKNCSSIKIKEFMFGLHGLSNYEVDDENNIEMLLNKLQENKSLETKKNLSDVFCINKIDHKIYFFNYITKNELEIGLAAKIFNKNIFWIISKKFKKLVHLLYWEGGVFKIENGFIKKLPFLTKKENFINSSTHNHLENFLNNKEFISLALLKEDCNGIINARSFLENANLISYFASAFKYTQFTCRSLGDLFVLTSKDCLDDITKTLTSKPYELNNQCLSLVNENEYFEKETQDFLLTSDFLILKNDLNKKIVKELKEIYFNSDDINIRSAIINGLLHKDNRFFIKEEILQFLKYSVCFFPSSLSRLYVLNRMKLEKTNVLAANIYDITKEPIDSYSYLHTAIENGLPTILQISLNAAGQSEINTNGSKVIGYLNPKEGILDFTNSICETVAKILEENKSYQKNLPFIGVGLDHVDVRGDTPFGRSCRFVRQAIASESITHITLDGSAKFKPKNKLTSELFDAYVEVFKTSLGFLEKTNLDTLDLEFCTGELNYIGEETSPHYPDGDEMSLLPICFSESLKEEVDNEYKTALLNSLKLYVGNLGTTHHGNDQLGSLKIELAGEWQKSLKGTNFITPVLHGTTNSSDELFALASKNCQKINIAGSFLQILLDNLDKSHKEILGYEFFNEKSKLLCSNFDLIKKDKSLSLSSKKELKKEYFRYSKINNVKPISKKNEKIIRKPLYGRNKIANYIFHQLEQKL